MTRAATFLSALSLVLTSAAAVSPITEYFFVGPYVTNAVKGLVMGDTGDYYAMRYEDKLFLREADLERFHLSNGFDDTNDYSSAKHTGRAVPAEIDWPIPTLCTDYLSDPDVGLSDDIRYQTGIVHRVTGWTNVFVTVTNVVTVSQTMTNGEEDVHTSWYAFQSNVVNIVVTNDHDIAINSANIKHLAFKTSPYTIRETRVIPASLKLFSGISGLPYSRRFVTNSYALVRSCRRTVALTGGAEVWEPTNLTYNSITVNTYGIHNDDKGDPPLEDTETESGAPIYYVKIYCAEYEKLGQRAKANVGSTGGWHLEPYVENDAYKIVYTGDPTISSFKVKTRIPLLAETDAGREIVTGMNVFLSFKIRHLRNTSIAYSTPTNASHYIRNTVSTNESFVAFLPLGRATRTASDGGMVTFGIHFENLGERIRSAIEGWGWAAITKATEPPALIAGKAGEKVVSKHDESGLTEWYTMRQIERSEQMEMFDRKIFYVLDLKPRTTLSTWNEYND